MNFTFDELKVARERDYSDDEIWGKLIEQDNSLSVAKERGYSLEEVASKLSGRPIPQEPEPEPSGVLRQAADIPIKVGEGFVGSVKSFADLFGADNAVSKELAGYEEWVGGLVSAESKQDSKEIARILKDAEDKGVYDKVIAGLEAFSKAPLEMSAQSVGYMIPQLAAGVLGKAAQLTKAGIIGTQAAVGFAQGVGMIKGDIYTATTDYLREKGVPEDQIDPIATKAQSYGGGNLDQMLIGGGLLAADAITGADAILTRVLTKQGKPVNDGIIKGIIKGGLKEGAIEVPQEGQQQVATNVALQREGYDVPTYQGAVSRAAIGGAAGFAMGGVLGGFQSMSPERKAEIKIDEAAEQAARDLETPSDNPAAMALSTEITRNQDAIENLRSDLDAMEPNDPRAQKLRFDISDRQKALTDLQLQYQKITGNDQEIPAVSIAASKRMELDNKIESLTEEIGMDEEALATLAEGSQERIDAQAALDKKKTDLASVSKEVEGLSLTIKPPVEAVAEADRNKDLFPETTDFMGKLPTEAAISSYTEKDGIGTATYVNPQNGSTDVYISAFGDNDFIAYIRIYDEQGNPTNRFASKLERRTERGGATRSMLEELQAMLPEGHEYTEDVSASTDGLRFISSQLNRGYELVRNKAGDVETNRIAINGESRVNDLGAEVIRSGQEFADIQVTNKKTFDRVKSVLAPVLEKFNAGLNENNIYWENGRVYVDIPVLRKTEKAVAGTATPSTTIEEAKTRIEELNTEFDALDENDKAGIDRVNTQIFAEQNKIAELTAIEQGVEPQGTTPTREMGLPPSGRTTTPTRPRMLAGEFYADRPILKAFMSATDKVVGRIPVFSKRAQKLKNAIRTGIAANAGFLAGTNTKVITSEEFGKLTGRKQVAADTGTYRATFLNGQKYLVVPDINQLAGISIKGEQRAASKDAALDQESRAAAKKLEEEVIHLSMFQGIQDEYKALKNPKLSEQEYVIKRLADIVKEVKRTNPNALPGVSNAYLNDNSKLLDDLSFSQEFMRMVIQRVRTGQITEDLNAIRQAEKEAFSDQDKGAIISLKNSILNALRVARDSITRYLGKGTSTKEVEKIKNAINTILDEYGIVKGEANYEFKDYSAAQPKGELKAEPIEEATAVEPTTPAKEVRNIEEASQETGVPQEKILAAAQRGEIAAVKVGKNWRFGQQAIDEINSKLSETITPTIEAKAGATPQQIAAAEKSTASKTALELIRGNYGELSDMINKIIDSNQKIADALQKIPVELTSKNSFDGETVRISKSFSGLNLVDAINHEITHSFLAVALREIPSFRDAINSIRLDAIERAKFSNDISFRGAVILISEAQSLSRGLIYTKKDTENLSQYMIRNTNGLMYLWNLDKTNPPFTYEIFETAYALASNDEFLAHLMSDKRFRDELKTYKVFTPDNRNLFQKFIDAISGLFQKVTRVEKTVLDKAMEQVERVVQLPEYNPRPIEGLAEMLAKSESGIIARAGVTPQMDTDYLTAVESGDMETAQRMVDEAAKKAGYDTFATHRTNAKFTVFDANKINKRDSGFIGDGFYFSPGGISQSNEGYGRNAYEVYLSGKFLDLNPRTADIDKIQQAVIDQVNEKRVSKGLEKLKTTDTQYQRIVNDFKMDTAMAESGIGAIASAIKKSSYVSTIAKRMGFDGAFEKNEIVVFDPSQIKSADPVTYDDAGDVIPLSERFDVTSPLIARAGETPQPSARSVKIEKKITQQIISDIEGLINDLKPKKDKSGQPYVSRTTLKGKTYASSLVSPFSKAVDLYKMSGYEMALSAFNKVLKGNPDASFFDIASNLTLRDENGEPYVTYGLSKEELANLIPLFNKVAPTYRQMVMDSDASFLDRSRIALSMPAIEFGLSKAVVKMMQAAGRTLNLAKTLRQMGGYGMAVANYKSNVQKSIGNLWSKIGGDMNDIATYARGDRRKAVDNVASLSKVISKLVSLQKMAIKNPEKARDSIRKAISRKQTEDTKKILLDFSASTFDDKTEKFANMIIDETAKAILSIGTKKGSSNTDSTYKKIYKAISSVAKQTAQEEETRKKEEEAKGKPKEKKQVAKREGKFLEQVGMVIGNDKTYKQFMDEVRKSIRQEYQSDAEFNAEYKGLFDMLSNREWSESMRQQAIKDSADALDYKFAELFQYIGSQRNAAQESVKTHMRFELQSMGATAEMVDKFTADVDNYLNEETRKVLEKKLGFVVDKETGKITGGQIIKDKMKELSTTEGQFKIAKTLKGLTRLAASDQRNFIDQLNQLMITELGFDDKASAELSKIIEDEITKAVIAQQSQNLKQAIDRVTKTLDDNNITAKGTTQRTILKRLIELANMGQLDDMKVYEAFRQTHNFGKGYLEYNPDMVQTLREWGDRISALPEGVMRGIEEQKMGRYMLEKGVFTTTDYISSYWYFALLSQVGTQAINIMGSTFNLMGNIATWGFYTKGKSLGPMMRGLSRAISGKQSPALNSFLYVMQTGLNPSGLQDEKMMIYPKGNVFENSTPENVPKLVYKLITFGADSVQSPSLNAILNTMSPRGMMRLMRATDSLMREVAYEVRSASLGATEFSQEQYDAAFRQAEAEMQGSKSATREKKKEIIIRTNEIIAEKRLDAQKREYAEQDSLEVVYSQKNAGLVGLIASFANKMLDAYPATRLFIPFTNVVANVLNENLNYAPLISQYRLMRAVELSPLLKGKIKLRPGSEKNPFIQGREDKAGDLAIKSIIGLAASALPFIIGAIAGGDDEDQDKERPFVQFYSQGPKDPEQNKIWTENGGTKYSIRFGNTYISYLFTPLVIPLSYGQMLKQEVDAIQKKAGEKGIGDVTELAFKVLASPVAIGFVAALDQSFLTGVSDLIELKDARDLPKAGAGIARNIISRMLVPGVARDMQKLMVDERLEGDLYITNMLKEFPGSSAFLDKDLNYFGDKARYNSIMQEDGFTRRAFSLVGRILATEKPDPAFEILYKNGITPPNWSQSLQWMDKTPMTKAEQREFIASAGPRMRQFIIDNESTISMLDTESAQKFVSNNFSAIRRGAKGMMEVNRTK